MSLSTPRSLPRFGVVRPKSPWANSLTYVPACVARLSMKWWSSNLDAFMLCIFRSRIAMALLNFTNIEVILTDIKYWDTKLEMENILPCWLYIRWCYDICKSKTTVNVKGNLCERSYLCRTRMGVFCFKTKSWRKQRQYMRNEIFKSI